MDDEPIGKADQFEWPELDQVHECTAAAEDVALWLHGLGIKQVDSYQDLYGMFNDYNLLHGYQYATARKIARLVKNSSYWRTCRGPKPKKKHYYKVKIPAKVLIREVA